jgi:hypothetical protein
MANRKKIVGTLVVIGVDGKIEERPIEVGDVAKEVRAVLDDHLEAVPYFSQYKGKRCVAFCGENGKRKGLAPNLLATTIWQLEFPPPHNQDYIAGPVAIVHGPANFMRAL